MSGAGTRRALLETIEGLFDFGRVTASKLATSTRQVLVSLTGNTSPDGDEQHPYQVLWGHAAVLMRPPADTELLYLRRNEEALALASREVRWLVDLSEGDVVLRNLNGDTPTRVRLLANGQVLIETSKLGTVDPGDAMSVATKALPLAQQTDTNFSTFQGKYDAHQHLAGGYTNGGGAVTGVSGQPQPASIVGALTSVASSRVFSKD